jgi:hypothetical protein
MSETKDPFNGKRGRQKGQTKDLVIIKDKAIEPYEIHIDNACFTLVEPGYNENMVSIGYFNNLGSVLTKIARYKLVSQNNQYTIKEYIKEYEQVIENLTKVIKYD